VRARAATVGGIAVLVGAAAAVAVWLARPVKALRYAGTQGAVRAEVALELDGTAPPDEVTVDLGRAGKVVAHRLP
jgi:hypothetical protein